MCVKREALQEDLEFSRSFNGHLVIPEVLACSVVQDSL